MQRNHDLSDSFRRLGIEEVKERLELAILSPAGGMFESPDLNDCCCCKNEHPDPEDSPPEEN